jgi:alpha-L-rhamnosidase
MLLQDFYWPFYDKEVVQADARELVKNPGGLIHDHTLPTTVYPDPRGDVELVYDLGEQSCGYYSFRLKAPAGTVLDIVQLEYISQDGDIQTPRESRNGMRYIAKEGVNEMVSIKRRSGRYIFLTLREMSGPVEIQNFHLIESTYPVDYQGSFACSDARLTQIWDISTRTLKLCMEDTYTDCPLYEQTHWVGDARNEALFGFGVFGAEDLARRCINITAQSLEHYPFAGCQTPSCWDTLLPAWSFLWGISTWDYYWQTGDKEFVREYFPAVIQNLRGTAAFLNEDGLFSGPFWNMFDWSGADQGHRTVTHNSMFMVGAIDAALKLSGAIGGTPDDKWLRTTRGRMVQAINKLWDEEKKSYPDSIHNDGKVSPSICQHTSFLSLLYDIADEENFEAILNNVLNPPDNMVKIGSPFAVLYLYETLEKFGYQDVIIEQIYKNYLPMLEVGSTTVWESFPGGTTIPKFPTRSHCHAWSSAPSMFLPRVVLGIIPTSPAAATVDLSPRVYDLDWAEGGALTTKGVVSVRWKKEANNTLKITCQAPEGVAVTFKSNPTLADFEQILLNGERVK